MFVYGWDMILINKPNYKNKGLIWNRAKLGFNAKIYIIIVQSIQTFDLYQVISSYYKQISKANLARSPLFLLFNF